MKVEQEIINVAKRLSNDDQLLLIQFVKLLEARCTNRTLRRERSFWEDLAGEFSTDDIREIAEAIKDCERIDEDSWR